MDFCIEYSCTYTYSNYVTYSKWNVIDFYDNKLIQHISINAL